MLVGLLCALMHVVAFLIVSVLAISLAVYHRASLLRWTLTAPPLSEARRRLMIRFLEWVLQMPVRLADASFLEDSIVLLGFEVPNPVRDDVKWTSHALLSIDLLEIGLHGSGIAGVLSSLRPQMFEVLGVTMTIGCAESRIGKLRLHGVTVNLEESAGLSNATLAAEAFAAEPPTSDDGANPSAAEAEATSSSPRRSAEVEGASTSSSSTAATAATTTSTSTTLVSSSTSAPSSAVGTPSRRGRPSGRSLWGGAFRGVKEGLLREALTMACGEHASSLFMQRAYDDDERRSAACALGGAHGTLSEHVRVDRVAVSSVTVRRALPSGEVRTLHVDGPVWSLDAFRGPRGRLGALAASGTLSRLLRDQIDQRLHEARHASERCVREAAASAAVTAASAASHAAHAAHAASHAASAHVRGAREVSSRVALDAVSASVATASVATASVAASVHATAGHVSGHARAAMHTSATFAKKQILGSVQSAAKLGLLGWSDANARQHGRLHTQPHEQSTE